MQSLWELSLLAKTAAHSASMQADPPPSRASSAPTIWPSTFRGNAVDCGSGLAREGGGSSSSNVDW